MPQPFLNMLEREALLQQKGRHGVPQIVEADMRQVGAAADLGKLLRDVIRAQRRAVRTAADIVGLMVIRTVMQPQLLLFLFQLQQIDPHTVHQRQGAVAGGGFDTVTVRHLPAAGDGRVVDRDRPAGKVHALPPQACGFAAPQAVYRSQHERRFRRGGARLLNEPMELIPGEGAADILFPLGQDDIIRGIMVDQALYDRILHAFVHNGVEFQDGCRRVAFLVLFVDKSLKITDGHGAEGQVPCVEEGIEVPAEHVPVAVQRVMPDLRGHHGQPFLQVVRDQHVRLGQRDLVGRCACGCLAEVNVYASVAFGIVWFWHGSSPFHGAWMKKQQSDIFIIDDRISQRNGDCG